MIRKSSTTDNQLHESSRPIGVINSALYYLEFTANKSLSPKVKTIGPSNILTKKLIGRINLPPLPLLVSNRSLRESMKTREKSPLFKVVASAIAVKYGNLLGEITDAIQQEKEKIFVGPNDFPLRIESTDDNLPEEKEVV